MKTEVELADLLHVVEAARKLSDRWTHEDFDEEWDDRAPERRQLRDALDRLEDTNAGR